jgi:predicted GH43/DUF377 family glycosyl hydrolase
MSGGAAGTWYRHVWAPVVLYNPDSLRYEMWFSASDGPPTWEPYRIGYATSADGINWTKLDTAVLKPDVGTWDETLVAVSTVIHDNGTYKMWYTGWSPSDDRGKMGYATSTNGINWTKYHANPVMTPGAATWEAGGPHWGSVMAVPGGGYKMWYTGYTIDYSKGEIGHATSADGITWTRADSVNPVLTTGSPGQWDDAEVWGAVFFINNVYHMWYVGLQAPDNIRQTGYAISSDGIHWKKYNDPSTKGTLYAESDPVLKPTSGQWDGSSTQSTTVMLEGDSLRMWYAGSRSPIGTHLWRIGHATAPFNTIYVPNNFPTIQAAIDSASDGNLVLVADGTYLENINFNGKAITVASHYYMDGDTSHITNTIIDGSNPSHPDTGTVVTFRSGEDTNSVIYGFTITGGTGTLADNGTVRVGGGISCLNSGGKIVFNKILNNHIVANLQSYGGGIGAGPPQSDEFIIVENNWIINNSIQGQEFSGGGGIYINANARVVNNIITGNMCNSEGFAVTGGGVDLRASIGYPREVTFGENTVTNNKALSSANSAEGGIGGGLWIGGVKAKIYNNTFYGNEVSGVNLSYGGGLIVHTMEPQSEFYNNLVDSNYYSGSAPCEGGGMLIWNSTMAIYNNIFVNNTGYFGGAAYIGTNSSYKPWLINNTITGNSAQYGGGIYNYQARPIIVNTILWGDTATYENEIYNSGGILTVRYSNIEGGFGGTGNIDVDPFFADTVLFNLTQNSPCVGAGIDSLQISGTWYYAPPFDYDGDPRPNPVDEYVDIGAQESDFPTGIIKEDSDYLPKTFFLKQNYPNPFNPITTIEFALPKTEFVTLKVYNLLGQEVSRLVSNKLTLGTYTYTWDAGSLASGVYMYRIEAGEYQEVRKMILMK